jgi:predicted transcriptional regulator
MAEDKRNKFERLGEKRMVQVLNDMDKVKKLSNRVNYEYSQKDVDKIKGALEEKVNEVVNAFEENLKKGGPKGKPQNQFSFTGRSKDNSAG